MKKIILLLLILSMLCGCAPAGNPEPTTIPTEPETEAAATTEATVEAFVEMEVQLEAVNKHAFYKTNESPTVAVLDERTAAYVTQEYQNKDYSKKYTHIRLMDLHMDVLRAEILLEGAYTLLPHSQLDGAMALVDNKNDEILVLDKALKEVLSFQARAKDGILTRDLTEYYYLWGSKLYSMDIGTGESTLCETGQELLMDELLGYDARENVLLVSIFEDSYTTDLCMGAVDLDDGGFSLLYRDLNAGKMAQDGVLLEMNHAEELMSDLYYGDWTDETLQILPGFLVNDLDFASWHIAGSDYVCKFTYDSQKVNIEDFQLYRLGRTPEVCSLQPQLKGAKINQTYALPDGNILAIAVGGRGYQSYLICPEKLEFVPAELEITQGDPLVDNTILEEYEKEIVFDLPEEMAQVRATADRLEETYDITILLSGQCALAASYCDMPITTTDQAEMYNEVASIQSALERLEEILPLYPADFFSQFKNEAGERGLLVLLVEDISDELNVIGVSYTMGQWYPVAVDITSGQLRSTYCHEIWHATENRISDLDKSALDLAAWEDCNPAGFRYPGEAKPGYMEDTRYTFFYGEPGEDVHFVDPYGKTNSKEDRARLMEYVMCEDREAAEMMKHPALKAKLQILCEGIRGAFDTASWENVYWERFSDSE